MKRSGWPRAMPSTTISWTKDTIKKSKASSRAMVHNLPDVYSHCSITVNWVGSHMLDASNLVLATYFVPPNDPRMLGTIKRINKCIDEGGLMANPMVFRYDDLKT